ncbi:hypothetical protein ACLI08_07870 [Flavobacterium sp. RNTU_13]|uniref:hypothetical protein n=1 Tax=Flavobacterium sp. RNTU_13 TaxID=3375145 RepID=UPI0039887900
MLLTILLTHPILGQVITDKEYEEETGRYIGKIIADNEKERQYIPKKYEFLGYSYNAIIDEPKQNGTNYKTDKTDDGSRDVIVVDSFGYKNKDKMIEEIVYYFDKKPKM